MAYFKTGVFLSDPWDQALPDDVRRTILSVGEWQELKDSGGAIPEPLGLRVEPGHAVETFVDDLARFALITIGFPKFTDGRAYSMAWLLRSRYGYRGELRATGDVLFDEMQFMVRCGFDAFEITDGETERLLRDGRRATIDRFYQPGLEPEVPEGTRPWARRSVPSGNLA